MFKQQGWSSKPQHPVGNGRQLQVWVYRSGDPPQPAPALQQFQKSPQVSRRSGSGQQWWWQVAALWRSQPDLAVKLPVGSVKIGRSIHPGVMLASSRMVGALLPESPDPLVLSKPALGGDTLVDRLRPLVSPLLAAVGVLACMQPGAHASSSFYTIHQPVQVPLYWKPIKYSGQIGNKLGIYAALGGSGTPQLFEFDTGGSGFYPAYSPSAPWWGSNAVDSGYTFTQSYDGGNNTYAGSLVTTSVSLFSGPNGSLPLFTAQDVIVGQAHTINGSAITPPYTQPPLEGAFWGDFGMALKRGKQGDGGKDAPFIDSLLAQLKYGPNVTPGFRVHASAENPWVQFGLGSSDLAVLPTTFALHPDGGKSPADVPYFSEYEIRGTLTVNDGTTEYVRDNTGVILDTGAFTTIHDDHGFPASLETGGFVVPGAQFKMFAPSSSGQDATVLEFTVGTTVDSDLLAITKDKHYLNTGILPFLSNDVIYNLQASTVTLAPQAPEPVPGPLSIGGVSVAAVMARRMRRLRRRLLQPQCGR